MKAELIRGEPIRIAIVNDFELVVAGVNEILKPFAERIEVVELNANTQVVQPVDIVLFDSFGAVLSIDSALDSVGDRWAAERIVLFTWDATDQVQGEARQAGIDAVVSKGLGAADLVEALEAVHRGAGFVVRGGEAIAVDEEPEQRPRRLNWPGRETGLSMREAEMVTLICQGLSNAQIAERSYLSPNSVKSYIRSAYRKMGVSTRAQAVAWGIGHGLLPEMRRKAV